MKCPNCLKDMIKRPNSGLIRSIKPRECFHCPIQENCWIEIRDPKNLKICHSYTFTFEEDKSLLYFLVSRDHPIDSNTDWNVKGYTKLFSNQNSAPLFSTDFIPISIGNEMHLEARALLDKFKKLLLFT